MNKPSTSLGAKLQKMTKKTPTKNDLVSLSVHQFDISALCVYALIDHTYMTGYVNHRFLYIAQP